MYKELEHIDEIIARCKENDQRAQERLYSDFYESMIKVCMRYTINEDDARVVLNTSFLKIFINIKQYDPRKATLYTWIRTIVVNSCIDYIKARQKRIVSYELSEAETLNIESEVDMKLNANQILHLIRSLPSTSQAIFNLSVIDGFSHKEIAKLLKISEATSRWHLSEARKSLRIQLQKENTY